MKDHFQEFNNSIGLYRGLVMNLTASQDRLRKLRDTLITTKESITKRGGDLSISLNRSQQYKEMLQLLQIMFVSPRSEVLTGRERLQAVPDRIENLITEKQFTSAVDILSEAIRILEQPEFKNVGALQDVSAYLKNQEAVFPLLTSKLIDSHCMTCLLKSYTIIYISNHHIVWIVGLRMKEANVSVPVSSKRRLILKSLARRMYRNSSIISTYPPNLILV